MDISSRQLTGTAFAFIGAVCFSGKAVLIKFTYQHHPVDAVTLQLLRMVFSLPFYLFFVLFKSKAAIWQQLSWKEKAAMPILGVLGYYLSTFLDFWGLQYISAGMERLILFVYPTMVLLLSAAFLSKPIYRKQFYALLLTYSGIGLAFVSDFRVEGENFWWGALLIFAAAFTYASYLVGSGRMIPRIGSSLYTGYVMIFATAAIVGHYLLRRPVAEVFQLTAPVYWLSVAMAIFATLIPTFMVSKGIALIGAGNAAIVASVGPVATIVMAHFWLGEAITFGQIGGTILVLAGVWLIGANKK
jgi:drug/metabolite transporter (DMT)-like permease